MASHRNLWLACAALVISAASAALADVRVDTGSNSQSNIDLWTERELYRPTGGAARRPDVSRNDTEIKVDGTRGRSGGAALVSNWHTDWNDSFSMRFNADLVAAPATNARQRAIAGVSFGLSRATTVPLTTGYRNGVSVEIRRESGGPTIQIVARKNGRIVASSERAPYIGGARDLEVSWIADPVARTVSVSVFDPALDSIVPRVKLDGVEQVFSGRRGGIRSALLGYSTGNHPFTATFKDITHSGDDYDDDGSDDDDDDWCDDDDHADDDGGSGGTTDFVSLAQFSAAWSVASQIDTDLIKAEAEDGGVEFIFKEDDTNVRVVLVNVSTNTVVRNDVRAAVGDESLQIGSLPMVTISAADAVAAHLSEVAGAMIHEVELEVEIENQVPTARWEIAYRNGAGDPRENSVPAS